VLGITSFSSNVLNEVQHESNQFGVLSLQKHIDDIDMQISAFVRNSVLSFSPDVIGDLLFNGVTPFARRSDLAEGARPTPAGGSMTATPFAEVFLARLKPPRSTPRLPCCPLVMKATDETTVHAGYSRYFVPPPFELVTPTAIALFNNTTNAPAVQQDDTVRAERSHYFDVGVNQVIVPGLTVGLDGYYKLARNLIDEGQFGAPIIFTAFNYAKAYVAGAVFTISYDQGPWSIYGNAAYSRAMGNDIISAQFNFKPDELAYIAQHYIHLDHDQTWTGSGGIAYTSTRIQNRKRVSRWTSWRKAACAPAPQPCLTARPCRNMPLSMRASFKSSTSGSGKERNFASTF
jgi:TonB dependent receptor